MTSTRARLSLAALALGAASLGSASLGCSAIVSPDTSRLGGGGDGGTHVLADGGVGVDGGSACEAGCDDGIACTVDACEAGRCTHTADDSACPGQRCSVTLGCVSAHCTTDAECQDGDVCNGAETCNPDGAGTGCVAAAIALSCDDAVGCTSDACDPVAGCTHTADASLCDDGIACTSDRCDPSVGGGCAHDLSDALCNDGTCTMGGRCTPGGCVGGTTRFCADDGNPCTIESCDEARGGCVSDGLDADGDGYPAQTAYGTTCVGGTDCNDASASAHPGATEVCANGIDDDCSGAIDEGCPTPTGESCEAPMAITLDGSGERYTGSVTVDLAGYADDQRADECGDTGGHDAVFYFDLPSGTYDVLLETQGDVDTVLAVSSGACDDATFDTQCNDDEDPGSVRTSRLWMHRFSAGVLGTTRVYVLVDGYDARETGEVQLDITASGARPDACGRTPLDISGGGTVVGVTPLGASGQSGTCEGSISIAPESVFRIDESDRSIQQIDIPTSSFDTHLYVRGGSCSSGTELTCVATDSTPTVSGVSRTDGSTFYVFVDNGPVTGGGTYVMRVDP